MLAIFVHVETSIDLKPVNQHIVFAQVVSINGAHNVVDEIYVLMLDIRIGHAGGTNEYTITHTPTYQY